MRSIPERTLHDFEFHVRRKGGEKQKVQDLHVLVRALPIDYVVSFVKAEYQRQIFSEDSPCAGELPALRQCGSA